MNKEQQDFTKLILVSVPVVNYGSHLLYRCREKLFDEAKEPINLLVVPLLELNSFPARMPLPT